MTSKGWAKVRVGSCSWTLSPTCWTHLRPVCRCPPTPGNREDFSSGRVLGPPGTGAAGGYARGGAFASGSGSGSERAREMLRVPRGLAGAAFLKLAFAARTMAGGTCRGDLGSRVGRAWSPPVEVHTEGGAKGCGGGGPRATPAGLGRGQVRGCCGSRALQTCSPQASRAPFFRAHGLAPRTPFAPSLRPGPAHRREISGGGGSWDHPWGAQHPRYGMERGSPGGGVEAVQESLSQWDLT